MNKFIILKDIYNAGTDVHLVSRGLIKNSLEGSQNPWHKLIFQRATEEGTYFDLTGGVPKEIIESLEKGGSLILPRTWAVQQGFYGSQEKLLGGVQTFLFRKNYPFCDHFNDAVLRQVIM